MGFSKKNWKVEVWKPVGQKCPYCDTCYRREKEESRGICDSCNDAQNAYQNGDWCRHCGEVGGAKHRKQYSGAGSVWACARLCESCFDSLEDREDLPGGKVAGQKALWFERIGEECRQLAGFEVSAMGLYLKGSEPSEAQKELKQRELQNFAAACQRNKEENDRQILAFE